MTEHIIKRISNHYRIRFSKNISIDEAIKIADDNHYNYQN